ncbi:PAS domain-containing protein [Sneathiella sp. P13V-1]|uniref:HD domain-containing phosphohydrolase n=1 Tax=Sneathiella sp. P13V-1 TaxID=2697366 RepID=UPI00187B22A4|nr:HD domain-containing phosphohydrolase [Sneathiella sp. P13V-1]MBE7638115.1 PAS domain-containing protein [Sneathiella sp. P13V-1]
MSDIIEETSTRKRTYKILSVGAIALASVVIAGVWGTLSFVNSQRERDIQNWEVQLGIVADSRAADVQRWITEQKAAVLSLAENESLQIYLTQLVIETGDNGSKITDVPEAGYLINLLNNQAVISGFWEPEEPEIRANVARPGRAGIALTDATGQLLVSSGSMPPMNPAIRAGMAEAANGVAAIIDIYEGLDGEPTMGFVQPVYSIQNEGSKDDIIGFIVGLRTVRKSLFPTLHQPGDTLETTDTYLVRKSDKLIDYISPLGDGTDALKRKLTADAKLAAAFVVENPGSFAARSNYLGDEVLVTGRAISGAPWYLVRSITTIEALAESKQRLNTMLGVFLLLIIGVTGTVIAVWRHGTSLRAAELAAKYKETADNLSERTEFLKIVTDQQPNAIAVFDKDDHYTFANKMAADDAQMNQTEIIGRSLLTAFNKDVGNQLKEILDRGRREKEIQSELVHVQTEEGDRVWMSEFVPLGKGDEHGSEMLGVFQDITEVVAEREQREKVLRSLVRTLVAFLDRRDPYSANQSARVAEVAIAISEELGAEDRIRRTVDIAGNLMNLGKILVPPELLTKTENLTDEEKAIIRDSMFASADLLEGVRFDLPVAEALRQLQEHWDGSGQPRGLKEEAISLPARILLVANDYVGMVSARAYRPALSINRALSILMEGTDKKYDRRPVSALINYVENKGGREDWAHFSNPPENIEES